MVDELNWRLGVIHLALVKELKKLQIRGSEDG